MNIQPAEIQELLATVREVLREHRRMALYAETYKGASVHMRTGLRGQETQTTEDSYRHDRAVNAVLAFDNIFKEPTP
jgi:hypothetical protein